MFAVSDLLLTHSLVDLPRWGLATCSRRPLRYLSSPLCSILWHLPFSWMYSQPVHSSMSCIHCLLGLPWCRNPSMIPSRTVSANSVLHIDKNHMILRLLVLTQYQRVTDRQTDTPPMAKSRCSIAERDKNELQTYIKRRSAWTKMF